MSHFQQSRTRVRHQNESTMNSTTKDQGSSSSSEASDDFTIDDSEERDSCFCLSLIRSVQKINSSEGLPTTDAQWVQHLKLSKPFRTDEGSPKVANDMMSILNTGMVEVFKRTEQIQGNCKSLKIALKVSEKTQMGLKRQLLAAEEASIAAEQRLQRLQEHHAISLDKLTERLAKAHDVVTRNHELLSTKAASLRCSEDLI